MNATVLALSRPAERIPATETAGWTVEINGQDFKLPEDVFIVNQIAFGQCMLPDCIPFPVYVFGKGGSTIVVSGMTGETGQPASYSLPSRKWTMPSNWK